MKVTELKELYMGRYGNEAMFDALMEGMNRFRRERKDALKARDEAKGGTEWYKASDMLGMMLYIDNFAGNLAGAKEKLPCLEKANVNYLHLMPFLDTVPERSDGGYAAM